MTKNPFLSIIPTDEMIELEGINIDEIVDKVKESGKVILIVGEHGSGKSQLINEIMKKVGGKKIQFKVSVLDEIRSIKKGPVFIEDFDLINGLSVETQKKIIKLIEDKAKMGITFVIECIPRIAKRIKFKDQIVFEMPEFTLEAAKKLALFRLNKVRLEKSNDFSPFTEKEIEIAWKKSSHNPRMFLMLLSTLYDIKVNK